MSLDAATVRRIAKLSRLHVEEAEIPHLAGELSAILGWIEQLNEVDVAGVEPMAGATQGTESGGVAMRMREDVVTDGDRMEAVLSNAPDRGPDPRAGRFYALPKVVE